MIGLILAVILVGITSYTDVTAMKIYNRHLVVFFLSGLFLIGWQGEYSLLMSATLIFAIYLIFYTGSRIMSNVAQTLGLPPLPEGANPLGGGDVKLAVTLALLLGHFPVLYGTLAGTMMLVLWQGVKQWQIVGSPRGVADVALGKVHAPCPFAPFLGCCSIAAAII